MEFKQIVGENIRHYRKLNGYTMKEIAEKIGITEATMQKYEVGKIGRVDIEMIQKIAGAIGTTPEQLTGWSSQPIQVDYLAHKITNDEYTLIEMFRKLDDDSQRNISDMVKRMYTYAEMMKKFKDGGLK